MELVAGPTLAERLEEGVFSITESLSSRSRSRERSKRRTRRGSSTATSNRKTSRLPLDGKVKVLDFGLAKAMDPAAGGAASAADLARSPTLMQSPTLTAVHGTQLGVILGTAAYMAPEQARGGAVDKRADIWAFGVVLYEMLTGRSLFAGETVSDTLAGVLKSEIDFSRLPPETPAAMRQLLRRCLERNPKNRLHDIADARIVIDEHACGGEGEPAAAAAIVAPPRGASRRERVAWSRRAPRGRRGGARRCCARKPRTAARHRRQRHPLLGRSRRRRGPCRASRRSRPTAGRSSTRCGPDDGPGRALDPLVRKRYEPDASPAPRAAQQPFWSPDGRQLAFFAGGQLKRLDLATGLVQDRGAASDPRGGGWSDNGEIYYSSGASSAMSQVSAARGRAVRRPARCRTRASRATVSRWPCRAARFSTPAPAPRRSRGSTGAARRARRRRRILTKSRASYDERGYLLWVHDGALVAQRFDPANGSSPASSPARRAGRRRRADGRRGLVRRLGPGTVALRTGSRESTELRWFDRGGAALGAVTSRRRTDGARCSLPTVARSRSDVDAAGRTGDVWIYDAPASTRASGSPSVPRGRDSRLVSRRPMGRVHLGPRERLRALSQGGGRQRRRGAPLRIGHREPGSTPGRPTGRVCLRALPPDRARDLWILPLDGSKKAMPFLAPRQRGARRHLSGRAPGRLRLGRRRCRRRSTSGLLAIRREATGSSRATAATGRPGAPTARSSTSAATTAVSARCRSRAPIRSRSARRRALPAAHPAAESHLEQDLLRPAPDGQRFLVNQLVGEGAARDRRRHELDAARGAAMIVAPGPGRHRSVALPISRWDSRRGTTRP